MNIIKFTKFCCLIGIFLFLESTVFADGEKKQAGEKAENINPDDTYYIFSGFKGTFKNAKKQAKNPGLYLFYSKDGFDWKPLLHDQPPFFPNKEKHSFRDPCIIKGPDGNFHMVWTGGWAKEISYARSKDLKNWTNIKKIKVMANEPKTRNCWAPEVFYDEEKKNYLIFWSSRIKGKHSDQRTYSTTTTDFETFTPAKEFFNPGFTQIDATILKDPKSGKFLMFFKDERFPGKDKNAGLPGKNLLMATSDKAAGPYTYDPKRLTGKYWCEGPSAAFINGQYIVYFDRHGFYGAIMSSDLKEWKEYPSKKLLPMDIRHGSILPVKGKVIQNLLKK